MDLKALKALIEKHEGRRLKPYTDPTGHLTIGVGRNLSEVGISNAEADFMFTQDIIRAIGSLCNTFKICLTDLPENRRDALIDMMFNLGEGTFGKFVNFIMAIRAKNWDKAADEMLDSAWHKQLPARVEELAEMIRRG